MATIFGAISVETPKYSVVEAKTGYEIRQYEQQIRAEVEYKAAGIMDGLNSPFGMLAGYIFGGNTARSAATPSTSEKVAMTAPVVTTRTPASEKVAMTAPVVSTQATSSGMHKMAFIVPSKYKSVDELPLPKDARVTFSNVPPQRLAATTFSGWMSNKMAANKESELRQKCEADGVKLSTDPAAVQYCQFNPPWCLGPLRKNEILIPLLA